jgi:hypothetical protein
MPRPTPSCWTIFTSITQVGDILSGCSAVTLKAGKEGRYEREGYGDRPYDNWEVRLGGGEGAGRGGG